MTSVDTSQEFGLIRVALPSLGEAVGASDLNGTEPESAELGEQPGAGRGGHHAREIGVQLLDLDLPSIDALLQGLAAE
jgi:hypothetical protein